MTVWHFMLEHGAEILVRTLEHLWLVIAAMGIAVLIGLPAGRRHGQREARCGAGCWARPTSSKPYPASPCLDS